MNRFSDRVASVLVLFFCLLGTAIFPKFQDARLWFLGEISSRPDYLLFGLCAAALYLINRARDPLFWITGAWLRILAVFSAMTLFICMDVRPWPILSEKTLWFGLAFCLLAFAASRLPVRLCWKKINLFKNLDDPLDKPSEDKLNRRSFSQSIFELVQSTQDDNLRIAITGEWGAGKTTCLQFIFDFASKAGLPVIQYNPWRFQNRQEAWKGFISEIDAGIANWKGTNVGLLRRNRLVTRIWEYVEGKYPTAKILDQLYVSRLFGFFEETKENVSRALHEELGGKRLLVIIDDLDRTPADIVYSIFMNIKEVVDLRGCVFICAFDIEATEAILKTGSGVTEPHLFLEKIFQWMLPLPKPKADDVFALADHLAETFKLRKEIIDELRSHLPENPRRLKNYLRRIHALETIFLKRFGEDDLNWRVIYLAELFKTIFPSEAEILSDNDKFHEWLGVYLFYSDKKGEDRKHLEEKEDWKKEISHLPRAEEVRFNSLLDKLGNSCFGLNKQQIGYHFRALSHPEVLTWKEFRELQKNPKEALLQYLLDTKKPIEERREFLRTLIRERNNLLSRESEEKVDQARREALMAEAMKITDQCLWFLQQEKLHDSEPALFDSTVVMEWFEQLAHWAHFKNNTFYVPIRDLEKRVAVALAEQTGRLADKILDHRFFSDYPGPGENTAAFNDIRVEIQTIYKKHLAKKLVAGFKAPDFIHQFWGKDAHWPEKDLLLKPNDIFYSAENIGALKNLAAEAKDNIIIHKNFYDLLNMIFYGAVNPASTFNQDEAVKLLQNDQLRELLWSAVMDKRIHRRSLGSLLEERLAIITRFQRADILPIPQWAKEHEADLVQKYSQQTSGKPSEISPQTARSPSPATTEATKIAVSESPEIKKPLPPIKKRVLKKTARSKMEKRKNKTLSEEAF